MGFRLYDVLIITALLDELEAVLALGEGGKSGWETDKDADGFPFHFREIPREDDGEPLRIAAASFDEMGGDATALRATSLIKFLDPACLAMCGICAGKKKDVFLGDVIVASRVYRYDSGKVSASRRDADGQRVEKFFHDFKTFNLKDSWRVDAAYFARERDWLAELEKARPLSLESQQRWLLRALLESEEQGTAAPDKHPDRKKCCPSFTAVRDRLRQRGLLVNKLGLLELTEEGRELAVDLSHEEEPPKDPDFRIHVGPIATAEVVQKDPELFDRLEWIGRKTLGAEMEAAALGRVGEHLGRPTLIVKAVSDYGDEDKDDAFRKFAARASAQVLLRLLLRNLEPVAQEIDNTLEPERRDAGTLHFEHIGQERRDDQPSRVQTLASVQMDAQEETARVDQIRVPTPLQGDRRGTQVGGPATSSFPVAASEEFDANAQSGSHPGQLQTNQQITSVATGSLATQPSQTATFAQDVSRVPAKAVPAPEDVPQSPSGTPTLASLRKFLNAALISDSDLDAFCLDHFPQVKSRFTNGMDRVHKTTLLLERERPELILEKFREHLPEDLATNKHLLVFEEALAEVGGQRPPEATSEALSGVLDKLATLLTDAFAQAALREFIASGPEGPVALSGPPSIPAGKKQFALRALAALHYRSQVNDDFFDRLRCERPHRATEITSVQALWAKVSNPASRNQHASPTRDGERPPEVLHGDAPTPIPAIRAAAPPSWNQMSTRAALGAAIRLDRSTQWAKVLETCQREQHAFFLLYGQSRQSLGLFLDRIHHYLAAEAGRPHGVYRVRFRHEHSFASSGAEWERHVSYALAPGQPGTAAHHIATAAHQQSLLLILGTSPLYDLTAEQENGLREFICENLPRMLTSAQPRHPVRTLIAVDFDEKAHSLEPKVDAWALEVEQQGVLAYCALPEVKFPTWEEVESYLRELRPRPTPAVIAKIKREFDAIISNESSTFQQLAERLDRHLMRDV